MLEAVEASGGWVTSVRASSPLPDAPEGGGSTAEGPAGHDAARRRPCRDTGARVALRGDRHRPRTRARLRLGPADQGDPP
ncbi:hypothetical protein DV701_18005 [Ornithinimicrobium avium]|uniref:Uncharacterized protein n=1 Tax=Ornithinimicrobium avium TaxID=2283195 RepID=A0A345NRU5_9MICO|nr:hypothetical protein DV701_18005 [Ornithinimicrobium avium]